MRGPNGQVMPRSVVDTSDSEPDEYKAPTDGRPRVISAERITAIRDGARAVAAQYHTPLHRDVYTLNPVRPWVRSPGHGGAQR